MEPIFEHVKNGDLSKVKDILNKDPSKLKVKDDLNKGLLHYAAEKEHLKIVKELINRKISVSALNKAGQTALHYAALNGHKKIVKNLLKANRNIIDNIDIMNSATALHYAAKKGHIDIVKMLLENNADPNVINKDGNTSLHLAAKDGRVDIVKLLISFKANVNSVDSQGNVPLHSALINSELFSNDSALEGRKLQTVTNKQLQTVKTLLENGADVTIKNDKGENPFDWAIRLRLIEISLILAASINDAKNAKRKEEINSLRKTSSESDSLGSKNKFSDKVNKRTTFSVTLSFEDSLPPSPRSV